MKEKTQVWSFRLTDSASEQLQKQIDSAGLTSAEFFKKIAAVNKVSELLPKQDILKVLYHHNIVSNKMNEIAEVCVRCYKDKLISNTTLEKMFTELKYIQMVQRNLINIITSNMKD